MKQKIYVLDGGAPGKVFYFSERMKKFNDYDIILLDNKGQKNNALNFEWLLSNLEETDKVLIISEHQLNYLQENKEKYLSIQNNLIYLRSNKSNNFNYLTSKALFTELPTLGVDIYEASYIELEQFINDPKFIVKDVSNTGSNGIFYNGSELIKGCKLDPNKKYIVQNYYSMDDWNFYSVPCIIKNGIVTCCIPLDNYTQFKSVVEKLRVNSTVLPIILKSVYEIVNTFELTDGVCEPEFVINKKDGSVRIMDLNPRWSFDCSTSTRIVNEDYNKDFDFLKWYMGGLTFYPDHDSDIWLLGKAYCKCTA